MIANEVDRKRAIRKFLQIYGLLLLAVAILMFSIFSSPSKIVQNEADKFSELKSQHGLLEQRTANLTTHLTGLVETQKFINHNPGSGPDSLLKRHRADFDLEFARFKADSAKALSPLVRNDFSNFMAAYDAVLFYLNTPSLEIAPSIGAHDPVRGPITGVVSPDLKYTQLEARYNALVRESDLLRAQVKACGEVGGAGLVACQELTAKVQKELEDAKSQISKLSEENKAKSEENKAKSDETKAKLDENKAKDVTIANLRAQLEATGNQTPPQMSDADRAQLIFEKVDGVVKKGKSVKKGVYVGLIDVLKSIRSSYPDKATLDRSMKDIDRLSKDPDF